MKYIQDNKYLQAKSTDYFMKQRSTRQNAFCIGLKKISCYQQYWHHKFLKYIKNIYGYADPSTIPQLSMLS